MAFCLVFAVSCVIFSYTTGLSILDNDGISALSHRDEYSESGENSDESLQDESDEDLSDEIYISTMLTRNLGYVCILMAIVFSYASGKCLCNYIKARNAHPQAVVVEVDFEKSSPPPAYRHFAPPNYETAILSEKNGEASQHTCKYSCTAIQKY